MYLTFVNAGGTLRNAYGSRPRWENTPEGQAYQRSQSNITQLREEYDRAYNEARDANEQRYGQILSGYDTLYSDTMSSLDGMGETARKDISTGYNKAFGQSMQGLVNAGMANSTIVPSVSLNNARSRETAHNRLNESLRRERIGYMNNITNNRLSFMERREDSYPNANLYASLMSNYGNYMGNVGYNTPSTQNNPYLNAG